MLEMTPQQEEELKLRAEENARALPLPANPETLARIAAELQKSTPDAGVAANLAARDPAIVATLLKTVNTALDGRAPGARSMQQVLGYLGGAGSVGLLEHLVRRHAFSAAEPVSVSALRDKAVRLALALGFLGRALGVAPRDEAYTFGLFRDAGRIVLMCRHPDYALRMQALDATDSSACTDHEKRHFGVDHAVVGAVLARDWLLPEAMSDAILWHHAEFVLALESPPIRAEAVGLIALGVLADRVLERHGSTSPQSYALRSTEHALRLLGTNAQQYDALQAEVLTLLAESEDRPMPTMRLQPLRA